MASLSCERRRFSLRLSVLLLCCFVAGECELVGAKAHETSNIYTEAEEFVLQQVAIGEVADFQTKKTNGLDARFLEHLLTGQLSGVRVSHEGVRISHAVINGRLALAGSQIAYATWLNDCEFKDDVDISGSHIRGSLSLGRSTFNGDVDLDSLQVDGYLVLEGAAFKGSFDLGGSVIAEGLEGSAAAFVGDGQEATQFDSIREENGIRLEGVIFKHPLSFDGAESQFLWLGSVAKKLDGYATLPGDCGCLASYINLSQVTIRRELHIRGMEIGDLIANGMRVEGVSDFERLNITHVVDFRHAQFKDLTLSNVQWPKSQASRQLAAITFQSVSPEPEDPAGSADPQNHDSEWKGLLDWVEGSSYAPTAFEQLEAAFRREGHADLADQTFEAMEQGAASQGGLGVQGGFKTFCFIGLSAMAGSHNGLSIGVFQS